jgi:hypothetical protein
MPSFQKPAAAPMRGPSIVPVSSGEMTDVRQKHILER